MKGCQDCGRGPVERQYPWCQRCIWSSKNSSSPNNWVPTDTYRDDYEVYIASPFFNPEQLAVVNMIRESLDAALITYFSPYHEGGLVEQMNPEMAERLFILDYMGIVNCDVVVAVLTYEGQTLYSERKSDGEIVKISLSDTGTVWEMGAGFALRKRVVGFIPERRTPSKMNIMLTECLDAVVEGVEELVDYLTGTSEGKRWEGKVQ